MKKIVLFCRVSTDRQSYDEQLEDLVKFAKSRGINDDEMLIIEGAGASAIKLNEAYLDMINKVQEAIKQNPGIEAVYLWALDRFGRDDSILVNMKNWFIANKINLIIKNPYLVLLNPDKTVNSGTELTYNILATIAKQEMQNKMVRFKRSKEANKKAGRYNGGILPFGYIVDKDGYFQIDPNGIVLELFNLYATGNYSFSELGREFQSRGFFPGQSDYTLRTRICQILKDRKYLGETNKYGRTYPRIVSNELFNECHEVASIKAKCKDTRKKQDKTYPCKSLVRCSCGKAMVVHSTSGAFTCNHCHRSVNLNMVEAVTWWAISPLYAMYATHKDETYRNETLANIDLLKNKIKVSQKSKEQANSRLDALNEKIYVDGSISIEKGDRLIRELKKKIDEFDREIESYNEQINTALTFISKTGNHDVNIANADDVYNITDDKIRFDILHEFVENIVPRKLNGVKTELIITLKSGVTLSYKIDSRNKMIILDDGRTIKENEFGYINRLNRAKYRNFK